MVIPSTLANTPCVDLEITGVLKKLNATLGTSYTLDQYPILNSFLDSCIKQNYDFGTAYTRFRRYSDLGSIAIVTEELRRREVQDGKMRHDVLCDGKISRKEVSPRRVWDLCANRVVPHWVAGCRPWGISHAWMDEKDRVDVWTPINGYEWPVPMPKDADLNLIRIEMLNKGAGYAWLDVLCLRQKYDPREDHLEEDRHREDLRVEEWKLDVPTIGYVYDKARVVYYLSGLGRPQSLTPGCFDSNRCWFNRAWTLQEIGPTCGTIRMGGYTSDDKVRTIFREQLQSLCNMHSVGDILSQMQKRMSTNPIDRVAGLVYLLNLRYIPIYDAEQSEEGAWVELVNAMKHSVRAELFFCFPEPGNGSRYWRPSWMQVMDVMFLDHFHSAVQIGRTEETDVDWYEGHCIDSVHVRGLDDTSKTLWYQYGELVVMDSTRVLHTFKAFSKPKYTIPDDSYTLLGADLGKWAVGKLGQHGEFQKLSVIMMTIADDDLKELRRLGILKHNVKMLC